MEWLNYHHLFYFWTVAREGGVLRAASALRLRPSTLSAQVRRLEDSLGHKLLARSGRRLVLTESGRLALGYAEEIFSLGREMQDAMRGRGAGRFFRFAAGVADVVPKLVAHRLLEPALRLPEPVRIVCREDRQDRLLADLALHELDVVITDAPSPPGIGVRVFSHLLGECGVSFFASPKRAASLRRGFPGSLDGAPFLAPTDDAAVRRALDAWFDDQGVRPSIVGEFEDSALLKAFGAAGAGVFTAPSVIEKAVERQFGVRAFGRSDALRERFYVVSAERRLRHPAVVAITDAARSRLFR